MALSPSERSTIATEIMQQRHAIATYASDRIFRTPFWDLRYGAQGRVTCYNDNCKNIDTFALAIRNGSPMIIDQHVTWLKGIYVNLGLCTPFLNQTFQYMEEAVNEYLTGAAADLFRQHLARARRSLAYEDTLAKEITAHQDAVVEMVVDGMYSSTPYWSVRYGERGRTSCKVDTYYNIAFLVDAIGMRVTKGILIHTGWMRQFLSSRGMCSAYYSDAWALLEEALISVLSPTHHKTIHDLVHLVRQRLRYDQPAALLIDQHMDEIIERVSAQHYDQTPLLKSLMSRHDYEVDLRYKISYLGDALANQQPSIMSQYLDWVRSVLPQLNFTVYELDRQLAILGNTLPSAIRREAQPLLGGASSIGINAHTSNLQANHTALVSDIWQALHGPSAIWGDVLSINQQSGWQSVIESAVAYIGDAFQTNNLLPTLKWLLAQTQRLGGSRAYLVDFTLALRQSVKLRLSAETAQKLEQMLDQTLVKLAEEDSALALLLIPRLVESIITTLSHYSPYWQLSYQRRSANQLAADIRALISFLSDELLGLNQVGFLAAVDVQRRYLLRQGVCTAYYQQIIETTQQGVQGVLDQETFMRAQVLLEAASASVESEHPLVLQIAHKQDQLVEFVIEYMRGNHPAWVSEYPSGWDDATTDLYYWLAYLTDTLNFKNGAILANHVAWLYELARNKGSDGDHIRLSLIALGRAIKDFMPNEARDILTVMQPALARLPGAR